ncbi:daunorubicin resistance protein DrrA family ABC transporter ATP-binding protein [Paenibacillus sp. J53TS2]|uniref:ATP-binding cassette domain-containing protein n=1 Tax=Paenibacillus sp. J53TS2 TaxID=2807197 RepID=UPI001AFF3A7F|nr:ATP-binding cassette domain-containing protein [Paenibacillus sp. J53TS2]GIP48756.1 daunorubicin resistance protein DrrA family ABC transporter ATP-binding protein [Paenibacillus sp. J53TS2]
MNHAIEISGLYKSFGSQTVLNGVDLVVPKGTVYALLGPNGAGKTTLIRILSTLTTPDAGTVRVAGYEVTAQTNEVKRSISLTGQFTAVDEVLSGEENLVMMGRLSGLTSKAARLRAAELLEQFDLTDAARKRVKTYSGGMRRRLDLAISLIVNRPVLFLDEPTTGLDTLSRRVLWGSITELARQGHTIFLTTQYLEEADQLADTIAVLKDGRIVATGTAEQLKAQVRSDRVELRDTDDQLLSRVPTDGTIRDLLGILNDLQSQVPADVRVSIQRPTMDEVFISLTSGDKEVSV